MQHSQLFGLSESTVISTCHLCQMANIQFTMLQSLFALSETLPCQLDTLRFYHIRLIVKSGKKRVESPHQSLPSSPPTNHKYEHHWWYWANDLWVRIAEEWLWKCTYSCKFPNPLAFVHSGESVTKIPCLKSCNFSHNNAKWTDPSSRMVVGDVAVRKIIADLW